MKRSHSLLALLVAALAASPLLATPLDGRKKDPPKQEKPKPEDKKPVEAAVKTLAIGTELDPATSLDDCTGQPHLLKRYRGKIVVLDFWSTSSATNPQTR